MIKNQKSTNTVIKLEQMTMAKKKYVAASMKNEHSMTMFVKHVVTISKDYWIYLVRMRYFFYVYRPFHHAMETLQKKFINPLTSLEYLLYIVLNNVEFE